MSKGSSSAPAAPDPTATANAQMGANIGTARVTGRMNRNDVSNPFYTSTWTDMGDPTRSPTGQPITAGGGGGTGTGGGAGEGGTADPNNPMSGEQQYLNQDRWRQDITLNPEEQALLNQSRRVQAAGGTLAEEQMFRVGNTLRAPAPTFDGLPQRSTGVDYGALQSVNPNFQRGGLVSALSGAGGNVQTSLAPAGDIQRDLNVAGQWDLGSVGGPDRSVGVDWGDQLQQVSDASYGQAKSRLDPQWQQAANDFGQSLADRGVPVGSDDYNKQMDAFQRQKTDAYQTALNNATMSGNSLLSTLGGLELGKYGAENAAQGQEFGQTQAQRNDLFDQAIRAGNFGNAAQQQQFTQNLGAGTFNNAAQSQLFGQDLAASQFANSTQNQDFAQQQSQQQLALQLRQQGLTEQQVQAALAEAARTGGYNELLTMRNQPLTDAQALMGMVG